jgi:hypothetical protein
MIGTQIGTIERPGSIMDMTMEIDPPIFQRNYRPV